MTEQHLVKEGPPVIDIHYKGMSIARVYVESDADADNARLISKAPELLELARRIRWLLAQRYYPGRERDEQTILNEAELVLREIER